LAPEDRAPAAAIALRAILYALAIIALVIFAPVGEHQFIYLGF
jgi:hypothetical protein